MAEALSAEPWAPCRLGVPDGEGEAVSGRGEGTNEAGKRRAELGVRRSAVERCAGRQESLVPYLRLAWAGDC